MEILELFGVDWKLMLAQLVNFVIVVVILWWFALKPLTKTMQSRSDEIKKGLSDAEAAGQRLEKVEEDVKAKLNEAKSEAIKILDQAKKQADESKIANIEKTKQEVEILIKKAKEQLASEKDSMITEVKGEVANMVVTALEKILSEGLNKDIDKKYIDKALKDLK
ncbi:F0F1 ATP synthase subunit B [bacterium]|nr:F0F1 ATP synthase subunit B [bacterium]